MDINSKLVDFSQKLVLIKNEGERNKIKASLKQLQEVIKNGNRLGPNINEFIVFGSYNRNTILPRRYDSRSDVDMMVVYSPVVAEMRPNFMRGQLREALEKAYPNNVVSKDQPVVRITMENIVFEVVPAYRVENSYGNGILYNIPDSNGQWHRINPRELNDKLTDKSQRHPNGAIINAIRLCKYWNAQTGYHFQSYEIEEQITNLYLRGDENTYDVFVKAMEKFAGIPHNAGQILREIKDLRNSNYQDRDGLEQYKLLRKLLPDLD